MKRKAIILLSSIMAGSLLVGGVLAATYAVTDNADPLGVKVAMSDLDTDTTTYVTLTWGESTLIQNVGKLEVGQNRKVGVVSLQSTENYEGVFSVSIQDDSGLGKLGDKYLRDYLKVYVFRGGSLDVDSEGNLPKATDQADMKIELATVADTNGKKTASINAIGNPTGAEYSVFVSLDDSAHTALTSISNDKVYLEVNWDAKQGEQATGNAVYFKKPAAWNTLYVYAYDGSHINAEWPGTSMTYLYDDIYRAVIRNEDFGTLIFSDYGANETGHIETTNYTTATPYYKEVSTGVFAWSALDPQEGANITGTVNDELVTLNNIKQSGSTDKAVYKLTGLAANSAVKFKDGSTQLDFYHYDSTQQQDVKDGDTFTATEAGDYIFYINPSNHVYGFKVVQIDYYLVGTMTEPTWAQQAAYKLTADPNDENHFTISNVALDAGDKVKVTDTNSTMNWFGNVSSWKDCFTVDAEGNIVIQPEQGGTYSFDFYVNSAENNHIVPTKTA